MRRKRLVDIEADVTRNARCTMFALRMSGFGVVTKLPHLWRSANPGLH